MKVRVIRSHCLGGGVDDDDSGAWRVAILVLAVAVALLAPFFARLIQMAGLTRWKKPWA